MGVSAVTANLGTGQGVPQGGGGVGAGVLSRRLALPGRGG